MIYIKADEEGTIQVISLEPLENCVPYSGYVPKDLIVKFSVGKYKFIDGQVIKVAGWVMPVIEEF